MDAIGLDPCIFSDLFFSPATSSKMHFRRSASNMIAIGPSDPSHPSETRSETSQETTSNSKRELISCITSCFAWCFCATFSLRIFLLDNFGFLQVTHLGGWSQDEVSG